MTEYTTNKSYVGQGRDIYDAIPQSMNKVAADVAQVNKDHGFAEPIPEVVTIQAENALHEIRKIVERFEVLRKDPDLDLSRGGMVDVDQSGYAAVKLLLVISEVIETHLADQTEHDEEVADIFIRMLDYAYTYGVDIDQEIAAKVVKNRARPYKHNRNF